MLYLQTEAHEENQHKLAIRAKQKETSSKLKLKIQNIYIWHPKYRIGNLKYKLYINLL
jgi:hypothetical protein